MHVKPILKEEKQPVRVSKIQFKKVDDVVENEEEENQSDSDLDSEISQELAELEEMEEEEDDSSLKKQV